MSMVPAEARLGACDPTQAIADFVQGFSIEATRPTAPEIDMLAVTVPSGTRVYLSAVPTRPTQEVLDSAIRLRAAGFSPVPHVAETFELHAVPGGTAFAYSGELGTDLWGLGRWWGDRVAAAWEDAVARSLQSVQAEAERRHGSTSPRRIA